MDKAKISIMRKFFRQVAVVDNSSYVLENNEREKYDSDSCLVASIDFWFEPDK